MPQEGMGVALVAQVRPVVTYSDPPEGTLIYTVFTKSVKNGPEGGTPVFDLVFSLHHLPRGSTREEARRSRFLVTPEHF